MYSDAGTIRRAIHLAALSERTWDEPFVTRKFQSGGARIDRQTIRDAVVEGVTRRRERDAEA
ncbi:hypothetical protein GCM10009549_43580 [Streptomyces thermoalcalitolerans]|uniref:Uncharacterized protein n=2 Tax=Streptomyces thermoalcalitolerans TaxID=65605 RepID=A0ABN1P7E9_9ACTN